MFAKRVQKAAPLTDCLSCLFSAVLAEGDYGITTLMWCFKGKVDSKLTFGNPASEGNRIQIYEVSRRARTSFRVSNDLSLRKRLSLQEGTIPKDPNSRYSDRGSKQ